MYKIDPDNSWTHGEFTVSASSDVLAVCGSLEYSLEDGDLSTLLTYSETERKITIYSEDRTLLANSPNEYTISSQLPGYTNVGVA